MKDKIFLIIFILIIFSVIYKALKLNLTKPREKVITALIIVFILFILMY